MSDNPTPRFTLTPEQRSRLVPNIDVDALERFVQIAGKNTEERNAFIQFFIQVPNQSFHFRTVGGDPTLEGLLDEIYAPTWEAWGADAIANWESPLPGRELARARLMAKNLPSAKGPTDPEPLQT